MSKSSKETNLLKISCFAVFILLQMFYVNPLTWAFRAAVLNEFQSPEYDTCDATDDSGCKALGQVEEQPVAGFSRWRCCRSCVGRRCQGRNCGCRSSSKRVRSVCFRRRGLVVRSYPYSAFRQTCCSFIFRCYRALLKLAALFPPKIFIDAYGFEDDEVYIWGGIVFLVVEFLLCTT